MENKNEIKQYILNLIADERSAVAASTTKHFGIARTTVYNYINELISDGAIRKTQNGYELTVSTICFLYKNDGKLSESRIYANDIEPIIADYPKNAISTWRYAFTEMMSNAIEHSEAKNITVKVVRNGLCTSMYIIDDGVGIFKKISNHLMSTANSESPLCDCAAMLYPGKFTTAPEAHSGEGIFFTSQVMDKFLIMSDDVFYSRGVYEAADAADIENESGTSVFMSLANDSNANTTEAFKRFSNAAGVFARTSIPVSRIFGGRDPISRSEALTLEKLLVGFDEIELDFTNVNEIGQSFAHELFCVWQKAHADVELSIVNVCDNVSFMIKRAINSRQN